MEWVHLFLKEKKDLKEVKVNNVFLCLKKKQKKNKNKSQTLKFSYKKCSTFQFLYQMKIIGLLKTIKITLIRMISKLVGLKNLCQEKNPQKLIRILKKVK